MFKYLKSFATLKVYEVEFSASRTRRETQAASKLRQFGKVQAVTDFTAIDNRTIFVFPIPY